jgi:phage shock protein PspC (stress-responsive transcriptional regulator)
MVAGVCSGVANSLGIDPVIVRIVWVFLLLPGGLPGLLPYLLLWVIMPLEPETARG